MMEKQSRKDIEALSAYMDGELSGRQRAILKARLQKDAGLQLVLDGLRQTRALLRSGPQVKAPRNFSLTAEMAGMRIRLARMFGAMQLVSVLATILFVVVAAGDLLASGGLPSSFITGGQADEAAISADKSGVEELGMAAESTPEAAMAAEDAVEDQGALEDDVDAQMAADTASEPPAEAIGTEETAAEDSLGETERMTTAEVKGTASDGTVGDAEDAGAAMDDAAADASAGTATQEITGEPTLLNATPVGAATIEMPAEGEGKERAMTPPEIVEGDAEDIGVAGGAVSEEEPRRANFLLIFVRVVEIGLALVAVGAGVTALVLRRRGRAN